LGLLLALAVGAGGSGAVLGLLKVPDPQRQVDAFAFTTAAAIEAARHADERAQKAEAALAVSQARVEELSKFGAAQELADVQEAERLGVARFMKDSTAIWGDDRRTIMATIVREARRNGLDPLLVAAVIQVESHFDPFAVSQVGARGLMQLMQPTAEWLLKDDLQPQHLFNPVLNIELGTAYLAQLMNRFGGDLNQALIAYNAGPSVARSLVRGSPSWKRLRAYPKAVLAAYAALCTPPQQVAAR
jgi:soluble lytic murein transglycosylase